MLSKIVRTALLASALITTTLSAYALDRSQIAEDANFVTPLLVGQKAPDVTIKTASGEQQKLSELFAQKPTVLLFYRGGWCPYCNSQLADFGRVEKKLYDLGYQVLAISTDTPEMLQQGKFETGYQAVRLSDHDLDAVRGFGLAFFLTPEKTAKYQEWKGDIFPKIKGDDRIVLPAPAAYILDKTGTVQFSYVNPDIKVRVDPELMYHAAKSALK